MTNEEMMIILERALLIPVKESDAAYILAIVEERLRNEGRPTTGAVDVAVPPADDDIVKDITRANLVASQPRH